MNPPEYTAKRLRAFLEEIKRLAASEFPYGHSEEALQVLKKKFKHHLSILEDSATDEDLIEQECLLVNEGIMIYQPILGFILRSTNVRNAFEVYGPILRLVGAILEPGLDIKKIRTRLILSSEWDYSPYVYRELPALPGFALVGLPAPESSNPLLVPLFGHELGHVIWERKEMELEVRHKLHDKIFEIIREQWLDFQEVFHEHRETSPDNIEDNSAISEDLTLSLELALRQAEESFSDFVGLYLFSNSFLHAFAYLISPGPPFARDVEYPHMKTRVKNLLNAAANYKMAIPFGYESLFEESINPKMTAADEFCLILAELALDRIINDLITKAKGIIVSSVFKKPSKKPTKKEQERILKMLRKVVPATDCNTLPDILNAAWKAYEDSHLWEDIPHVMKKKDSVLKDLILKNIEVFEIEQIMGTPA